MPVISPSSLSQAGFTASLVCAELAPVVNAYTQLFGLHAGPVMHIDHLLANAWHQPSLSGMAYCILTNDADQPWLRVIELPGCHTTIPVNYFGWMALQLGVNNLSLILPRLAQHDFHIIGDPVFTDLSRQVSVRQCIGPAGELLYLADNQQLCAALNMDCYHHNHLIMPVLAASSHITSTAFYARLANQHPRYRNSRLTVVNRALNRSIDCRYPVATIPFKDHTLLEIDEIGLCVLPPSSQPLPSGIAMLTITIDDLSLVNPVSGEQTYTIDNDYYGGRPALLLQGPDGEWIECIEQKVS